MAVAIKKEWSGKTGQELMKKLSDLRSELKESRFKIMTKELKNVRSLRRVKREIACLLTILNQKIK